MELFLAENHAPMTHLPIAVSLLAALALFASLFWKGKQTELLWVWALLSILAFLVSIPAIVTGMSAAIGRMYADAPGLIENIPDNAPIALHQRLGIAGALIALFNAILGFRHLRQKKNAIVLVFSSTILLACIWGYAGHLGGKTAWSPETFPAYEHLIDSESGK